MIVIICFDSCYYILLYLLQLMLLVELLIVNTITVLLKFMNKRIGGAAAIKVSLREISVNRYKKQVLDKVGQMLVQLVAVLRNFSTDGRLNPLRTFCTIFLLNNVYEFLSSVAEVDRNY